MNANANEIYCKIDTRNSANYQAKDEWQANK